ncbi:MAG: type III secretion inner membrane ring lipoprotein SctJ [Deltaproteobacteria bacterium]|jgi:type III secretion protein J|nr:type III secretion inner membrane ring lipoprotein SctJ [Deltaproteobacteria bacterium]
MRLSVRLGPAALACVLAALLLSGCRSELYTGLGEEEANRMLVLLLANDFQADKVNLGKNGFALTVDERHVAAALELLSANGYPRDKHENLGQIFSGQGMISTPVEEQSRLAYALSQELAETFSRVDGVLTARVHVVLEARDQSGAVSSPASAAVVLRHLPDSPAVNLTAKIKEVSSKSVPGLAEERVSVMLVPARVEVILPSVSDGARLLTTKTVLPGLLALGLAAWLLVGRLRAKRASDLAGQTGQAANGLQADQK